MHSKFEFERLNYGVRVSYLGLEINIRQCKRCAKLILYKGLPIWRLMRNG